MLTHILLLVAAVSACTIIAKLEKSNRLFWMLLVSMLVGYTASGILSYVQNHDDRTQCCISVDNSTQTPTCSFQAMLAEGDGTFIEIKSVGQRNATYINTLYDKKIPVAAHPTDMQNLPFIYDTS